MDKRCVDVITINERGERSITSFCFERTALTYVREAGLTGYTVSIRGRVIARG